MIEVENQVTVDISVGNVEARLYSEVEVLKGYSPDTAVAFWLILGPYPVIDYYSHWEVA